MLLPRIVAYDTRDVCLPYYRGPVVMSVSYRGRGLRSLFLPLRIQWPYLYVYCLRHGHRGYSAGFSLEETVIYRNEIAIPMVFSWIYSIIVS